MNEAEPSPNGDVILTRTRRVERSASFVSFPGEPAPLAAAGSHETIGNIRAFTAEKWR